MALGKLPGFAPIMNPYNTLEDTYLPRYANIDIFIPSDLGIRQAVVGQQSGVGQGVIHQWTHRLQQRDEYGIVDCSQ